MKDAPRYQGVEKHSSGFKLMAAMGWKEGEGLVGSLLMRICFADPGRQRLPANMPR